ncbi:MAG TPA: hypothetical protein VN316_02235 [candidate division Zixibacteria bacterium]|nr:hypothetical protein [candidate division Zixibacteria bacterium]
MPIYRYRGAQALTQATFNQQPPMCEERALRRRASLAAALRSELMGPIHS